MTMRYGLHLLKPIEEWLEAENSRHYFVIDVHRTPAELDKQPLVAVDVADKTDAIMGSRMKKSHWYCCYYRCSPWLVVEARKSHETDHCGRFQRESTFTNAWLFIFHSGAFQIKGGSSHTNLYKGKMTNWLMLSDEWRSRNEQCPPINAAGFRGFHAFPHCPKDSETDSQHWTQISIHFELH